MVFTFMQVGGWHKFLLTSMVAHKSHNNFFKHYNLYCFILIFLLLSIASLNFENHFLIKYYFEFDDLENIFKEFH